MILFAATRPWNALIGLVTRIQPWERTEGDDLALAAMGAACVLFFFLWRQRQELRKQRHFNSAILDTADSLIVVIGRQDYIRHFNRACERLTGNTFAEVRGHTIWDLFLLPNAIGGIRDTFIQLQAGHCPISYENSWVTREGKSHQIAWVNTVLVDANGETTHIVATGIDITAHVQAEMALSVSEARLRDRETELQRAQAGLTCREWEVLTLLARDDLATYGQIGGQLHVSAGPIKTHLHRIGQALGLASKGRSAVVAEARARGLLVTSNTSCFETYGDIERSFE